MPTSSRFARHAIGGSTRRGPRTAETYAESKVDARVDDAAIELIADAERSARAQLLLGHRVALERLTECLASHRQAGPRELAQWLARGPPTD